MSGRAGIGVLVLALTAALGAVGCGGDESTSTAQPLPRLTKAQFVKKVDAVCFKNSQNQANEVEAVKKENGYSIGSVPPIPFQEKVIVRIILPIVRKTIGELEEMGEEIRPPRNLEATLGEFVAALKKATTISEKTPRWLAEPSKKYEPFMDARELAGKMGTYLCGQA